MSTNKESQRYTEIGRAPIAVIFPGQGSQRIGMAQDFYNNFIESRNVFERASEAINVDLREICFSENKLIDSTKYAQPAILTAEIAMLEALQKNYDLCPEYYSGHSLGEYTALVAGKVFALEDGVRIVMERGALMQSTIKQGDGAMSALILENIPVDRIKEFCRPGKVEIANYNSKDQIVISGYSKLLSEVTRKLQVIFPEIRIVPLNISAPFHSTLMYSIANSFRRVLESYVKKIIFNYCSPILSNFTGFFHTPQSLINNLVSQISAPVLWRENMKILKGLGVRIIEIGPQRVLGRFLISEGISCDSIIDLRSLEKLHGKIFSNAI